MKKIIYVILICCLCFGVGGCSSGGSATSVFEKFDKNTTISEVEKKYNITEKDEKGKLVYCNSDDIVKIAGVEGTLSFIFIDGNLHSMNWRSDTNTNYSNFLEKVSKELDKKYDSSDSQMNHQLEDGFGDNYYWYGDKSTYTVQLVKETENSDYYMVFIFCLFL